MEQNFDSITKENTHILLCAIEDKSLTGFVMGVVYKKLSGDCRPFLVLENMIIDRASRRKGIGKTLLAAPEETTKKI